MSNSSINSFNQGTENLHSLIKKVQTSYPDLRATLMEVCGTHTNAIRRAGIHRMLPSGVRLLSGPGCPVCVTGSGFIEQATKQTTMPDSMCMTPPCVSTERNVASTLLTVAAGEVSF